MFRFNYSLTRQSKSQKFVQLYTDPRLRVSPIPPFDRLPAEIRSHLVSNGITGISPFVRTMSSVFSQQDSYYVVCNEYDELKKAFDIWSVMTKMNVYTHSRTSYPEFNDSVSPSIRNILLLYESDHTLEEIERIRDALYSKYKFGAFRIVILGQYYCEFAFSKLSVLMPCYSLVSDLNKTVVVDMDQYNDYQSFDADYAEYENMFKFKFLRGILANKIKEEEEKKKIAESKYLLELHQLFKEHYMQSVEVVSKNGYIRTNNYTHTTMSDDIVTQITRYTGNRSVIDLFGGIGHKWNDSYVYNDCNSLTAIVALVNATFNCYHLEVKSVDYKNVTGKYDLAIVDPPWSMLDKLDEIVETSLQLAPSVLLLMPNDVVVKCGERVYKNLKVSLYLIGSLGPDPFLVESPCFIPDGVYRMLITPDSSDGKYVVKIGSFYANLYKEPLVYLEQDQPSIVSSNENKLCNDEIKKKGKKKKNRNNKKKNIDNGKLGASVQRPTIKDFPSEILGEEKLKKGNVKIQLTKKMGSDCVANSGAVNVHVNSDNNDGRVNELVKKAHGLSSVRKIILDSNPGSCLPRGVYPLNHVLDLC